MEGFLRTRASLLTTPLQTFLAVFTIYLATFNYLADCYTIVSVDRSLYKTTLQLTHFPCSTLLVLCQGKVYAETFSVSCRYTLSQLLDWLILICLITGFAFPLFTTPMYEGMTYQWASFLAGCLALLLSATPFVLMIYGPRIRAKVS